MERATRKNRFVALFMMIALMFSFVAPLSQPAAASVAPVSSKASISKAADQGTGDPLLFCDFRNQPNQGDVATWWANNNVAPDCIDLSITNSPATCSLTANFASYVYALGRYGDTLYWFETDAAGNVLRNPDNTPLNWGNSGQTGPSGSSFTVSFPEDHQGGTAYVLINFASPENQIQPGLDQVDLDHWRTTSKGQVYEVNTDCEAPLYFLGCSQGYFKNNGFGGNENTTLADAGLITPYAGTTTLFEVLSNPGSGKIQRGVQTYDGYTRQQVTAYLNYLQFGGDYPISLTDIQTGAAEMWELEYYNHGGEDVICP